MDEYYGRLTDHIFSYFLKQTLLRFGEGMNNKSTDLSKQIMALLGSVHPRFDIPMPLLWQN